MARLPAEVACHLFPERRPGLAEFVAFDRSQRGSRLFLLGMRRATEHCRHALDAEPDPPQGRPPTAAERVAAPVEHRAESVDEGPGRHGCRGDAHPGLDATGLGRLQDRTGALRVAGERAAGVAQRVVESRHRRVDGLLLHEGDLVDVE